MCYAGQLGLKTDECWFFNLSLGLRTSALGACLANLFVTDISENDKKYYAIQNTLIG